MIQWLNRIISRLRKRDTDARNKARDQSILTKKDKIKTAPLSKMDEMDGFQAKPMQFLVASGQSTGKQRDNNEDSLFTFSITVGNPTSNQPLGIFIIADGMGGHHHGEIASDIAIRTVSGTLIKKLLPVISNGSASIDEPLQDILKESVMEAQKSIHKKSPGSGTTLTAVLALGEQMILAHIGDSRAYTLHPKGGIETITRDHSLARRLEELGQSPVDSNDHPQRNVLYRSLGIGDDMEADIFTDHFPQPGYLMLCSDGLWGVVPDLKMNKIIFEANSIQSACRELVEAANSAGGPDNISVILVQLI